MECRVGQAVPLMLQAAESASATRSQGGVCAANDTSDGQYHSSSTPRCGFIINCPSLPSRCGPISQSCTDPAHVQLHQAISAVRGAEMDQHRVPGDQPIVPPIRRTQPATRHDVLDADGPALVADLCMHPLDAVEKELHLVKVVDAHLHQLEPRRAPLADLADRA